MTTPTVETEDEKQTHRIFRAGYWKLRAKHDNRDKLKEMDPRTRLAAVMKATRLNAKKCKADGVIAPPLETWAEAVTALEAAISEW